MYGTNPSYISGLYETTVSISGTYNSFGLVVNKIVGGPNVADGLNFDEWYIYGKEISGTADLTYQVPKEGCLNYNLTGWEVSDIVGDTSNYTLNTSNAISTRITNLPQPNLSPYRLIADSFTKAENNTQIFNNSNYTLNTSNNISTRISNLPQPNLSTYRLKTHSYTKAESNTQILNNSNYTLTSNVISNNLNNKVSSQWTTIGWDINHITGNVGIGTTNLFQRLTVIGNTQMNGVLNIIELYQIPMLVRLY